RLDVTLIFCFGKNKCLTLNFKKMKNLENFGVQEMNAQELVCIDGGGFLAWILGAMAGIAHGQSQYIDEYGNYYPKQY
ncbi:MAG: hypothetical protein COZ17_11495, partial [Flavobacteriaceae bacterium CG_4_10_14_3_um_filter_33_47]